MQHIDPAASSQEPRHTFFALFGRCPGEVRVGKNRGTHPGRVPLVTGESRIRVQTIPLLHAIIRHCAVQIENALGDTEAVEIPIGLNGVHENVLDVLVTERGIHRKQ
jgi:hypothetical protein